MAFLPALKNNYVLIFSALLLVIVVHISYLGGGFIGIDHGDIDFGHAIRPLGSIATMFLERFGATGFYRPLVTLFDSLDATFYNIWAPGFHATSLLLHIAFALSAMFFVRYFFSLGKRLSILVMVIVGVHPLSWPIVGAVHYRSEQLVAIFTLLAVTFHILARTRRLPIYIWLTFLSLLAALFSKEVAIVWIPVLIFFWEMHNRRVTGKFSVPGFMWFLIAMEISAIVLYIPLRVHAVPETWRVGATVMSFATRLSAVGIQIRNLLSPFLPHLSDAVPHTGFLNPLPLIMICVVFAGLFIFRYVGLFSQAGMVFLFLGVVLAPALGIVPVPRLGSPHYGYIATIGVGVLAALILQAVQKKPKAVYRVTVAILVVWVITASISTFLGGFHFKNDETLFKPEVARDPYFLEGYYFLGNYYYARGDYENAAQSFQRALDQASGDVVIAYLDKSGTLVNLAGVRLEEKKFDEAEKLLEQAADASPRPEPPIIYNRAVIASRQGKDATVVDILKSYQGEWEILEPPLLLIASLVRTGQAKEAREILDHYEYLLNQQDLEEMRRFVEENLKSP